MLAVGRATPGLRTLTVVAAASAVPSAVALPLLVLGSVVFLEVHLVLGYVLGAAAARVLAAAGPVVVAVVVLLALAALARILLRRRSREDLQSWSEAACPACLAVRVGAGERSGGSRRTRRRPRAPTGPRR
jgi:hypothetical protein